MNIRPWFPLRGGRDVARRQEGDPIAEFRQELDSLFDDVFSGVALPALAPTRAAARLTMPTPRVEVSETDDAIRLTAELPGMDESDVEVTLVDDLLTIQGEKVAERVEKQDERRNYHLAERSYGMFSRSFRLPFAVDPSQIQAVFKNGVLTIDVQKPKALHQKAHKIELQSDAGAQRPNQASEGGQKAASAEKSTEPAAAGEGARH